ncbi:MAG: GNAT family N-acetyltransferase [Spirochaetales bacterium]|nr:GNAT family N-acetyltransferase [Spirochaetales bacterium]
MKKAVSISTYTSIHSIDSLHWDSILSGNEFFHQHAFLTSMENAHVMDATFRYLIFYEGKTIIGSAVLSHFSICLDLFLGKMIQILFDKIRKLLPGFFRINILFCGLPISIGKPNIIIKNNLYKNEIIDLVIDKMETLCEEENINNLCFKEFLQYESSQDMDYIKKYDFIRAPSLPYGTLEIKWNSFTDYLSSLKHHYRNLIKKSLKKINMTTPVLIEYDPAMEQPEYPQLILENGELCSHRIFHSLYLNVMERAEVKLEVLNSSFFKELIRNMKPEMKILSFVLNGRVLGAALIHSKGEKMTFLLIGLDYTKNRCYDVYFNLIYGIISLAIKEGCKYLDMGQTSHFIKQRVGSRFIPVHFYIRSKNILVQTMLKSFKTILFPEVSLPELRVFRDQ